MERETDVPSSDLPANKILFKHFLIVNPKACNQYNSVVVVVVAIFRGVKKKSIQNMFDNCELFIPSKKTIERLLLDTYIYHEAARNKYGEKTHLRLLH